MTTSPITHESGVDAAVPAVQGRGEALGVLALWASLFVIAALVIVQLGGGRSLLGPAGEARADLVTSVDDFTALTFYGGSNEDILVVMDGRGENLFVYRVQNQRTVEFLDRLGLPEVFETSRRIGAGGGK